MAEQIENPQLQIEGRDAWRVVVIDWQHAEVEPFYGKVDLGEIAVTTASVWRCIGWLENDHPQWMRTTAVEDTVLVAMLRMWLAAKEAWDNQRKLFQEEIAIAREMLLPHQLKKLDEEMKR